MARKTYNRSALFTLAWQMVKCNGFSLSKALTVAWRNFKLKVRMGTRIVRFWFQKVDGTIREAYGTLCDTLIPMAQSQGQRKPNKTVQVYYDTEKAEFRSFKVANLARFE